MDVLTFKYVDHLYLWVRVFAHLRGLCRLYFKGNNYRGTKHIKDCGLKDHSFIKSKEISGLIRSFWTNDAEGYFDIKADQWLAS
jgi:hypothetical protein